MTTPSITKTIKNLVEGIREASAEYYELAFDEKLPDGRAGPCTASALAKLEAHFGHSLPPSYREFMKMHDGWSAFEGDAKLLSVDDFDADWVRDRVQDLDYMFEEFAPGHSPFADGCIPVFLGVDEPNFAVLNPNSRDADGECEVIVYEHSQKEKTFTSFASYLAWQLDIYRSLVQAEKDGR